MKSLHVEMLMGHDTGLAASYYRPPESDLLDDYMTHAADSLTIDPTFRLQKHVTKLETERTEEIAELKRRLEITEAHHKTYTNKLLDGVIAMTEVFQELDFFKQLPRKEQQQLKDKIIKLRMKKLT